MEYAQIADIEFTTPQLKRRKSKSEINCSLLGNTSTCESESELICLVSQPESQAPLPSPHDQELDVLYKGLSKCGKPVILSHTPGYCDPYKPLSSTGTLPKPLTCCIAWTIWICLILISYTSVKNCMTVIEFLLASARM